MEPAGTHLDRALDASSRREPWVKTTHPRRISRPAADRPAVVCRDAGEAVAASHFVSLRTTCGQQEQKENEFLE